MLGRPFLPLALALAAAPAAQAGPLASASLTIEIAGAFLSFPGAGATGTATRDLSATLGAGSVFAGTESVTLTGSAAVQSPVDRFRILIGSNAAAAFGGLTPAQVGGSADVDGVASLYATANSLSPFLIVPLRLGRTTEGTLMGGGLSWSIWGAPWTAGTATLFGFFGSTTRTPVLTVTGMNALSAMGAGVLTLVSPMKVRISTGTTYPVVATLTLTYVPEPGTALLLGTGALGLALLGRRG